MNDNVKLALERDLREAMTCLQEAMELLNNWRLSPSEPSGGTPASSEAGSVATPTGPRVRQVSISDGDLPF